jgi:acetylglutamate synthase
MTKANIILEYLRLIGAKKETEMYLQGFRNVEPKRFAVIAIDSKTLSLYVREVASALAYLSTLGLTPTIVHDGVGALGKQLVSEIWTSQGKCRALMSAIYSNPSNLAEEAAKIIAAKAMPIIETESIVKTLDNILPAMKPRKLVLLNRTGGVKTKSNGLVSYINLPNEYEAIMKNVSDDYGQLLHLVNSIIKKADWKLHVEIVPPNGLLTELFTIKGSGTFVKKGPKILSLKVGEVDSPKLRKLLEESFGKNLNSKYLGRLKDNSLIFVEENYSGAAVVEKVDGMHYIDKLAVMPKVQGEGLARDLISSVMNHCSAVFWRANPANHINEWYLKLCSGMQKESKWYVYWSGLSLEQIKKAVEFSLDKPADFVS